MADPDTQPPLVASVAVEVSLPHLDRPFDYLVPAAHRDRITVGCRVRVRFAGRLMTGFVLGLSDRSEAGVTLRPLERVISAEPVLTAEVARLCRSVADHYAGVFADVVRQAVPARHARNEAAAVLERPAPEAGPPPAVLPRYAGGAAYLDALGAGQPLRAAWTPVAVCDEPGDWAGGLIEAAAATLAAGRGVILVVPDADAVRHLDERCEAAFGAGSYAVLAAELGEGPRYRAFLDVLRGSVRLVLGTRSAVFAPVADLGLIAVWDEGNDALADQQAPYLHAREVAAIRAGEQRCALLLAGFARTAEVAALVERGWLVSVDVPQAQARRWGPLARVAADTDLALERDQAARVARLPHDVFGAIRSGLASGPVLIQVPRSGYVSQVVCARCRAVAACPRCHAELRGSQGVGASWALRCPLCGPVAHWRCSSCGGTRVRAPRIGVARTAEELGRAFPQVRVVESWSGHLIDRVPDEPALVLATPGAEPQADGGYAAAILLDTGLLLSRPELRAAEEALRRWLAVCAQVRPAERGGTVMAVGEPEARALQALIRLDPIGFAARELQERRSTGFPPAAKLVMVEGPPAALDGFVTAAGTIADAEVFGPFEVETGVARLTIRAPLAQSKPLLAAIKEESARQSAAKRSGGLRVRVDPQVIA